MLDVDGYTERFNVKNTHPVSVLILISERYDDKLCGHEAIHTTQRYYQYIVKL